MSAEPSPESPTEGRESGSSGAPPPPPVPGHDGPFQTEKQLNSPTPLTLRLLGIVFAFTFLPWVGAKLACNDREGPVRTPHDQPTDVVAKQPKSAGLELQQRAATSHYREAAELAKGDLARELMAADARCQAEPRPCEERRAQSAHTFTRAVLVSRGSSTAQVRAQTQIGDQVEGVSLRLESEAGRWYVVGREPFTGELTDPVPARDAATLSIPLTAPAHGTPHGAAQPTPAPADPHAP